MKKIVYIVALVAFAFMATAMITSCTASQQRGLKTIGSNWGGGLNRHIEVYTQQGQKLYEFDGNVDIQESSGGKVMFDLPTAQGSKRVILYNALVVALEK